MRLGLMVSMMSEIFERLFVPFAWVVFWFLVVGVPLSFVSGVVFKTVKRFREERQEVGFGKRKRSQQMVWWAGKGRKQK